MTITARYASRCAACQGSIAVGEQIEWVKGQPSRHAACPATRPTFRAQPMADARGSRIYGCCEDCGRVDRPGTVCPINGRH